MRPIIETAINKITEKTRALIGTLKKDWMAAKWCVTILLRLTGQRVLVTIEATQSDCPCLML